MEQMLVVLCRVALAAIVCRLVFRLVLLWAILFLIKIDLSPPTQDPESGVMYLVVAFKVFDVYFVVFFKKCFLQADYCRMYFCL